MQDHVKHDKALCMLYNTAYILCMAQGDAYKQSG